MLEFVLLLPLFMFFITFTVDMGRVMFMHGVLQDATYQAARNGAQSGLPQDPSVRTTFDRAVDEAPSMDADRIASFDAGPATCGSGTNAYVRVSSTYSADFITPGFSTLLGIFAGENKGPEGDWQLGARAVARCEVTRQ
jgi:Flp pilus assembly protein TadG